MSALESANIPTEDLKKHIFLFNKSLEGLKAEEYPNFEAIVLAGWRVD